MGVLNKGVWAVFFLAFFPIMALAEGGYSDPLLELAKIEPARRSVRAKIQDFADDLARAKYQRHDRCPLRVPRELTPEVDLVKKLSKFITGSPELNNSGSLSAIARGAHFTLKEKQSLDRLAQVKVSSIIERIRLMIETQALVMRVSNRLYLERIAAHTERALDPNYFSYADPELCAGVAIQITRDQDMISGATIVLHHYDWMEKELNKILDGDHRFSDPS